MPTASSLRDLVYLMRPVDRDAGAGAVTRAWEHADEAWARIVRLSARERLRADQSEATVTHKIEMRAHPDIGHKWKLRTPEGIEYHIQSVIRPTASRFMELLATEVA